VQNRQRWFDAPTIPLRQYLFAGRSGARRNKTKRKNMGPVETGPQPYHLNQKLAVFNP
jgi:hypothetical protein